MMWCFKGKYKITSGYKLPERLDHNGIDAVGLEDKTIYAPCDGIIGASTRVYIGKTAEWGEYIRLDTADDLWWSYFAHLNTRFVVKGQKVKAGDKLGIMGNTGKSTGAHLHLEVRKKGTSISVNPADVFGIPNKVTPKGGFYLFDKNVEAVRKELETGNDIVWQLINGRLRVKISEPERAVKALDKAKDNAEFMSLYWIIRKVVNEHGF